MPARENTRKLTGEEVRRMAPSTARAVEKGLHYCLECRDWKDHMTEDHPAVVVGEDDG